MPEQHIPTTPEPPLYRRIQSELRRRIADGDLRPGQALPSRNALTAEFGTTRVTLDKAIQQLVDEGVLTSTKGSGTFVAEFDGNGNGRRRATARIGIVLGLETPDTADVRDDFDHIFFGPIFRGISDALSGKPIEITYLHLPAADCLALHTEGKLDAFLLVTPTVEDLSSLVRLQRAGVPFVALSISSTEPEHADLPCVDGANYTGGYAAARHMLDLGHQRLACVNLATTHANHRDRMRGFRDALVDAGLDRNAAFVLHDTYSADQFDGVLDEWLMRAVSMGQLPTGVFACDFTMTLKTLAALRRRGIDVPGDVSLIGFDDPLIAEHLTPPLTTVRQPIYSMGQRAANRLVESLLDPTGQRPIAGQEIVPVELIVRESTSRPSG